MHMGDFSEFIRTKCAEESVGNLERRAKLIEEIEALAVEWSECEWTRLMVFGSSLLGVLTEDSDIDTVLVLPSRITREQVFESFVRRLSQGGFCDSLVAIPDAHVPVIKLTVGGFEVDVLTAHLSMDNLKQMASQGVLSLSQRVFEEVDYTSLLSLNGVRVGHMIIDAVCGDEARFRRVLKIVKHWAKRRGVYSNALGFFGGITWAILLAKIFQISSPFASDADALAAFFRHWSNYQWSSSSPVSLSIATNSPDRAASALDRATDGQAEGQSLWDPSANEGDRKSLMPVLTPATPSMNSTFNTMASNARIIKEELRRASEAKDLDSLCEQVRREGLALQISIDCPDAKKRLKWCGLVESKLRVLLTHLEAFPGVLARPFPDARTGEDAGVVVFEVGVAFAMKKGGTVDFRPAVANFKNAVDLALSARSDHEELVRNCRVSIFAAQ